MNKLQAYIQARTDAGEFEQLAEELTQLLYVGFEAGGVPGNLPQLHELIPPPMGYTAEWLVIPDRAALKRSITLILDNQL